MKKATKKQKATAYHEAGHALAYMLKRKAFQYVTIEPDDALDSLGHVRGIPDTFNPEFLVEGQGQLRIERDVICSLAGLAAETKFRGRHNWQGAHGDGRSARDLLERFHIAASPSVWPEEIEAHYAWLKIHTQKFVWDEGNWCMVEALAEALLREKKISARRARKIMRRGKAERLAAKTGKPVEAFLFSARRRKVKKESAGDGPDGE